MTKRFRLILLLATRAVLAGAEEVGMDQILAPGAQLEALPGTYQFTEGPVWMPAGFLVWSDIPANRLYRWSPERGNDVFREPSGHANGNALDLEGGMLLTCQHDRRVVCWDDEGRLKVLAERFEGKRLNSPNDLVVRRVDGSIYFTDPPYGLNRQAEGKELDFQGLFRLFPNGSLVLLARNFNRPNGLAFSPDEKLLYVADTEARHMRVFEVKPDGSLGGERVFAEVANPDGMKVDAEGNVYCTSRDGVVVFTPEGKRLGLIPTPSAATNVCFGGTDGRTLFITAGKQVHWIQLRLSGALVPKGAR